MQFLCTGSVIYYKARGLEIEYSRLHRSNRSGYRIHRCLVVIRIGDYREMVLGVLVQLVRILACHARGRGFESHTLRHPTPQNWAQRD